jgi:hypothetical protein
LICIIFAGASSSTLKRFVCVASFCDAWKAFRPSCRKLQEQSNGAHASTHATLDRRTMLNPISCSARLVFFAWTPAERQPSTLQGKAE